MAEESDITKASTSQKKKGAGEEGGRVRRGATMKTEDRQGKRRLEGKEDDVNEDRK